MVTEKHLRELEQDLSEFEDVHPSTEIIVTVDDITVLLETIRKSQKIFKKYYDDAGYCLVCGNGNRNCVMCSEH